MPRYKIAHIKEQGQVMIIIPLDPSFGFKTDSDQEQVIAELQAHATGAGLDGIVVPVWDKAGRMAFRAPYRWHPFFQSLNLATVSSNLNRELYW
jgi:hypothetical protein